MTLPLVPIDPDLRPKYDNAEWALLIDNSTLELLRCPRLLELKWVKKRDLVAAKAGRNFGSALHVGLAERYRHCGNQPVTPEAVPLITKAMADYFAESPSPLDDFRDLNHAVRVMQAYNAHYTKEPFTILRNNEGIPIVERSFAFYFATINNTPVFYIGKIDLAVIDTVGLWSKSGDLWVMDTKSTYQFGDTFHAQMQMDGGQLGYCWSVHQATGIMPRGYVINAIRVRKPKRGDEYSETPSVDASDFIRTPYIVYPDTLDDWKADTIELIKTIFWHADNEYFPRHRWQCTNKFGRCDMFDVCSVTKASRDAVLASSLYEDYTWSPLNTPKI